jgi:Domain of unknown function (DUF4384)
VPLAANAALQGRFSHRLLAAVDAGLAVRPEARPQSMAQFRLSLDLPNVDEATTAQTTKAVSARSSGPSAPVSKAPNKSPSHPQQAKKPPLAFISAGVASLAIAAAGAWWWSNNAAPKPVAVNPQSVQPTTQAPVATVGTSKPPPAPAPIVAKPFSASQSLNDLQQTAKGGFDVTAKAGQPEVRIGKDKLEFQIQSNKSGFAYVYLLNTVGEMYLLFPNALDKRNRIESGATLTLPKASWAMNADGPAGTDEFVVLVSEHERDLKTSGIQHEGVFGQFSLKILQALEAARGTGPSPLLGQPICPGGTPCADNYGAASFKIVEK